MSYMEILEEIKENLKKEKEKEKLIMKIKEILETEMLINIPNPYIYMFNPFLFINNKPK